ncbi:MAG: hypothetical protein V3S89_07015 [Desulfobacterales bacterium]
MRNRIMRILSHNNKGTTLVEIVVTLAVTTMMMTVVSKTFLLQKKTYSVQGQITQMVQTARSTMDFMRGEIKMAGYNPADAAFDGVVYDASQLTFYADLNGDGDTSDADEMITYVYDSDNLQINRDTGTGIQPLADNIQGFGFEYMETDGAATKVSGDIRRVRIIISVRAETPDANYSDNGGYRTYTLTSMVAPKNLAL